jgi:hypothetical protein
MISENDRITLLPMDNQLLETAAGNFDDAQDLMGAAQLQRIALGLMQVARAVRPGSRNPPLLETAAGNFDDAQDLTGDLQVQRLALGLMQLARGLKR